VTVLSRLSSDVAENEIYRTRGINKEVHIDGKTVYEPSQQGRLIYLHVYFTLEALAMATPKVAVAAQ
jgi:hypothetical protein